MQEIERFEQEIKGKKGYFKKGLEDQMRWAFSKGVDILKMSKKEEVNQETKDWFLGRISKRTFDVDKEIVEKLKAKGVLEKE